MIGHPPFRLAFVVALGVLNQACRCNCGANIETSGDSGESGSGFELILIDNTSTVAVYTTTTTTPTFTISTSTTTPTSTRVATPTNATPVTNGSTGVGNTPFIIQIVSNDRLPILAFALAGLLLLFVCVCCWWRTRQQRKISVLNDLRVAAHRNRDSSRRTQPRLRGGRGERVNHRLSCNMNNRHSDVDHHNDHEDETRELDARPTRTSLSPNPAFTFSGGGGGRRRRYVLCNTAQHMEMMIFAV